MSRKASWITNTLASITLIVVVGACQKQEGPAERAGKEVDKAVDKVGQQVEKAGGTYFMGRGDHNPDTFYEVKYKDPNGVVFDITHSGWRGAVKEVLPAREEVPAG